MRQVRIVKTRSNLLTIALVVFDPTGIPAYVEQNVDDLSGKTITELKQKIDIMRRALNKPVIDAEDLL